MRELWVLYRCVLRHFSVSPTHTFAHFAPKITKNYKTFSMWLQIKTKLKHRTHYAIFQNLRICASCLIIELCALCGLCIFAIYIHGCGLRLLVWLIRLVYAALACMSVKGARARACLTVLCICKCRCKIYYTL